MTSSNTKKSEFLRRARAVILASILAVALFGLSACGGGSNSSQSGSGTSGNTGEPASKVSREIVIGTMITEDILPMWAAERDGLFAEHGIEARVETFQSAQELSTAMASGAVDMCMTDPMVAASLYAGGTEVALQWVTLGETPEQGRFGIMASPESGISSLQDLADVPIGVGSNTILEYVMDKLMEDAGIPAEQVKVMEIKKIPARYEAMTSNQVAAAALPNSLLVLGEATGMVLVADDTTGANLSQSVMVARNEFAQSEEGALALEIIKAVWDEAAAAINADPSAYKALLAEKAISSMPEAVQQAYPMPTYPQAKLPTSEMVDPVLAWMLDKGYLDIELTYDAETGAFKS